MFRWGCYAGAELVSMRDWLRRIWHAGVIPEPDPAASQADDERHARDNAEIRARLNDENGPAQA